MPECLTLLMDRMQTPIGELLLAVDETGCLRALDWADYEDRMLRLLGLHYGKNGFQIQVERNPHGFGHKMEGYFAGDVACVKDMPVQTAGTPFQRSVWTALRTIPGGSVLSYGKLAEQIGRPKAVRAVGLANGANPIGIVVPCHRVIGRNGDLTGYGGGLHRKQWLLDHEQRNVGSQSIGF